MPSTGGFFVLDTAIVCTSPDEDEDDDDLGDDEREDDDEDDDWSLTSIGADVTVVVAAATAGAATGAATLACSTTAAAITGVAVVVKRGDERGEPRGDDRSFAIDSARARAMLGKYGGGSVVGASGNSMSTGRTSDFSLVVTLKYVGVPSLRTISFLCLTAAITTNVC
jgi:hypothetical protein